MQRIRNREEAVTLGKAKVAKVIKLLGGMLAKRGSSARRVSRSFYVHEWMTRKPRSCAANDTLHQAAAIMWDNDCGCVPVVDEQGRPIAMITDRDICMGAYTQGRSLRELVISSVVSRRVVTVRESQSIEAAEALMQVHRVRRLCVIDVDGRLLGILSMGDLARHADLADQSADSIGRILAAISEPAVRHAARLAV